jgi:hypothetical protein
LYPQGTCYDGDKYRVSASDVCYYKVHVYDDRNKSVYVDIFEDGTVKRAVENR